MEPERCPVSLPVVSRHLATLRDAGVVVAERRGKHVFYRLRPHALAHPLRQIADALEDRPQAPADRLTR